MTASLAADSPLGTGLTLVTPSYRGDLARFRRLAASVNALCGPEVEHLVVVPAADVPLFAPLCGPRQRLLAEHEAMPVRFWRLPKALNPLRTGRDVWLRPGCLPVRGWIMQQIVKFAAARVAAHDTLVYADSDTVLLRPLTGGLLDSGGRLRLFHETGVTGHLPAHRKWYDTIARLLGIPQDRFFGDNYVGDFITWKRGNVEALIAHLERRGRTAWWKQLANSLHFSEYMLYGIFCDHVLGAEAAGQSRDARHICLASWGHDLTTEAGIEAYVNALRPDQVACSVQSQEPISIAVRDAIIDRLAARAVQQGETR